MYAHFEKIIVAPTQSFRIEERSIARFDAPWHFHPEIELTHIVESRGRRFVGDSVEAFVEGDLVLLGPNLPHFWHNEDQQQSGAKAHSIVVQFKASFMGEQFWESPEFAELRRLLRRASRGLSFPGAPIPEITARLQNLTKLAALPALAELLTILHLLTHARNIRPLASSAYEPILDHLAEARFARVHAFLMQGFRAPLSLSEIAVVACMTPEAFSRYFKRMTGRNVSVFIAQLRIDYAASFLRETTHPIGDIAANSGFATLSSFNRHFLERMRCTPRQYRLVYQEKTSQGVDFPNS
jgi:AraC-like DNA-binding protein